MEKAPNKKILNVIITLGFLALIWNFIRSTKLSVLTQEELFWISILYLLCSFPTVMFVLRENSKVPVLPVWGLGYFMMFGMPLLSEDEKWSILYYSKATVLSALELTVSGAFACLVAFYSPIGKKVSSFLPKVKMPWETERAPLFGAILCLIGSVLFVIETLYTIPSSIKQIIAIVSQTSTIGMLILFLLQLRGALPKSYLFFLWGIIFPLQLLVRLGSGLVFEVIVLGAPFIFLYTTERQKIPWVPIILSVAIIIPFLGTKHEYRSYAWYGHESEVDIGTTPISKGLAFIELTHKRLTEGGLEGYTVAAETAESRISHLGILADLLETTPITIPYWNGESYLTLLWVFVPRFIYPDKPAKNIGQRFGHRYGYLNEEDLYTSFNLPHQVIEMYINFGKTGVLIGMTLIGLLYRTLDDVLSQKDFGERGLVIGSALMVNLVTLESDFSLILGGLIYFLIISYVAFKFFPTSGQALLPREAS